jgi:hypothetical protein
LLAAIFSNSSDCRRKLYDETGSLEDSEQLSGDAFDNLYEYYRAMYPKASAASPQLSTAQQLSCTAAVVLMSLQLL